MLAVNKKSPKKQLKTCLKTSTLPKSDTFFRFISSQTQKNRNYPPQNSPKIFKEPRGERRETSQGHSSIGLKFGQFTARTWKKRPQNSGANWTTYGGFLKWWVSPTNPWVFLLKMIILGCEMGVPPFEETSIYTLNFVDCFVHHFS